MSSEKNPTKGEKCHICGRETSSTVLIVVEKLPEASPVLVYRPEPQFFSICPECAQRLREEVKSIATDIAKRLMSEGQNLCVMYFPGELRITVKNGAVSAVYSDPEVGIDGLTVRNIANIVSVPLQTVEDRLSALPRDVLRIEVYRTVTLGTNKMGDLAYQPTYVGIAVVTLSSGRALCLVSYREVIERLRKKISEQAKTIDETSTSSPEHSSQDTSQTAQRAGTGGS